MWVQSACVRCNMSIWRWALDRRFRATCAPTTHRVACVVVQIDTLCCCPGEPSPPLPIALPLPILHSWATLLRVASRLGVPSVSRAAAATLSAHFTVTKPPQPPWVQHPMDRLRPNLQSFASASAPLLRSYALAVFCHCDAVVQKLPKEPLAADCVSATAAQVQRLVATKRLLIAMEARTLALYSPRPKLARIEHHAVNSLQQTRKLLATCAPCLPCTVLL